MPNRSDVDRVERELLRAQRRAARRLDRHVRRPLRADRARRTATAGRVATDAQRALLAPARGRAARGSNGPRPLGALRRLRRRARRDRGRARVRAARAGASSTATSPSSTPPTAPSSTGSGSGTASCERRHAAERLAGELDAWDGAPGLRVRLRGPDRRGVGAARGARRPRRGDRLAPVRAGPRRVRLARAHGRGPRRASRTGGSRSCRRAPREVARTRRSRTSSARSSRDGAPGARRRSTARSASSRAPARAATLELVAEEMLALLRAGTPAGGDRRRLPVARALAGAARDRVRRRSASRTRSRAACGSARRRSARRSLGLLRFAWLGGEPARPVRVPALAVLRACPRRTSTSSRAGCAAAASARRSGSRRRSRSCAGSRCRALERAPRRPTTRSTAVREPRARDAARRVRARGAARRRGARGSTCAPTRRWRGSSDELERLARARRRARAARTSSPRSSARPCAGAARGEAGPRRRARPAARAHAALRGRLRARARGGRPAAPRGRARRSSTTSARRELERSSRAGRLLRPDPVARDRYLFYTACTRPTRRLYLVREAATDDGRPREPSPFWDEVRARLRARRRRALDAPPAALRADLAARDARRPSASACARSRALAPADARRGRRARRARTAGSGGSSARSSAFERPTRLTHPAVLDELRREDDASRVTELERFADCSSMWFVERVARPEDDRRARSTRGCAGSVAHQALFTLLHGPAEASSAPSRSSRSALDEALAFLRECLDDALAAQRPARADRARAARARGEPLARPRAVRARRGRVARSPLVPRRFEVSFGTERSAPELQRGLDLGGFTLSGKIDRIDRRPVQRARDRPGLQVGQDARTRRAQIETRAAAPDPALHARAARPRRDRAARRRSTARSPASGRRAGCCAPRRATTACPGSRATTTSTRTRSGRRSSARSEHARGDRRADPRRATCGTTRRAATCPSWCDLWPMCRVKRA